MDEAKLNSKMEGSEIFIKRMDGPFLQKIAVRNLKEENKTNINKLKTKIPFIEKITKEIASLEKEGEDLLTMHGEKTGATTTQKMMGTVLNGGKTKETNKQTNN